MKIKNPVWRQLYVYGVITAGCAVYALAFNWFFEPNHISIGGFTGVAQVISRLIPALPVGVTAIVLNVPLFYLGVRRMGWRFLFSSLYAAAASSLILDGMALLHTFQPMDPMLACVYGGVLLGASSGMMLCVGATTGGTELAARLLKYRFHGLSIGRLCLTLDVTVIFLYALTFRNIHYSLYGIIAMYISSLAMDAVVYGSVNAKMAYIISDNGPEMTERLLGLNLGLTVLKGRGGFSGDEKQVVLCAFKPSQIAAIKAAVTEIDPGAFIIVCEAREVLGEGFGAYDPNGL